MKLKGRSFAYFIDVGKLSLTSVVYIANFVLFGKENSNSSL